MKQIKAIALLILWPVTLWSAEPLMKVSIAIPKLNDKRRIELKGSDSSFPIIIRNVSGVAQKVWVEWYSWGHDALSFELTDGNGKEWVVRRKTQSWQKNAPQYWTLEANDELVIPVSWSDGSWEGLDFLATVTDRPKKTNLRMKAVFNVVPDSESKKENTWVGKEVSPENEYVIYDWRK